MEKVYFGKGQASYAVGPFSMVQDSPPHALAVLNDGAAAHEWGQ